ncbi:AbrB family transcriptional regulator [Hylemonella gracilis]|uniref:AbrB family transcriptional regulator n=1 Tax=Hylemonella gracilis TaxID=80880 RepID=A0A4P6UIW9_9BURK|nr:AbrB family transcriptional regulator [Hylemonella gracilis]QBK05288.1 AbrB family transcriptional regulator [Hylemonella gracilis]
MKYLVRLGPWAALLALSALLVAPLELARLPAGFLLGPMLAGILIRNLSLGPRAAAASEAPRPQSPRGPQIPLLGVNLAQAVVGLLIARTVTPEIIRTVLDHWPLFLGFTLSTLLFSALLGWWFTRLRLVPGTTAIWGLLPGGAGAVVLMAGEYGADARIVAFMQYLRVLVVTVLASLIAGWSAHPSSSPVVANDWFPPLATPGFMQTAALIVAAIAIGRFSRIANGTMLVAMVAGAMLHDTGLMHIELPPWLLATSFTALGWSIGLRFTREVLGSARRVLPATVLCIVVLIAACGLLGWLMAHLLGTDPLTAYLATSPGGADSVAVIAASSPVNAPLVMAFQTARLFAVIAVGPAMSRYIATRLAPVRPPLPSN